jgi:murein DD-endopeptidase MepM/ murein hydrolase activator NlpD
VLEQARQHQSQAEQALTLFDQQARAEQASIATLQAQYQRELEEMERQRQEALRRAAAQATATAQAQATAAAQATAQARAQATAQARAQATAQAEAARARQATPTAAPATGATPRATPSVPSRTATPVAVQGSIATAGLGPSPEGFIWPVANPVVTTEFGERSPGQLYHTGIDLAQKLYTPIRAAADGIVIESGLAVPGKPSQSYGMRVSIAHPRGYATLYAHLDDERQKPTVKAGDRVKQGDVIGYIGMTGITTGPHLHFEILVSGSAKNPRLYLPK